MKVTPLLRPVPAELPDELNEILVAEDAVRVERIVSRGHCSPDGFWYDQEENEWVVLLAGNARLEFEDGNRLVSLDSGDSLLIPAHVRHRVDWTDPETHTVWLAVFYR